jgi:YqaJ-like viral recombinase domain
VKIFDYPQGSPEWHKVRAGKPTASKFSAILAKGEGKTRKKYLYQLAGEIVSDTVIETYSNAHMERGRAMEEEARNKYAFLHSGTKLQQVGFVFNGVLEIKTKLPDLLIDCILADRVPPEHMAQCQGNIWLSEREWLDLVVHYTNMPQFEKRVYRDDIYIKKTLMPEIRSFNDDLNDLVAKLRARL